MNTASVKQISFYNALLDQIERSGRFQAAEIDGARQDFPSKSVAEASDAIARAKRTVQHLTGEQTSLTTAPHDGKFVPAGRYAIEADGVIKFYAVDRPTEGKWAGYTFVKVQASDDLFPVKGQAAKAVLAAIAVDPKAALVRYGHAIGKCGLCGRTLTDEESRAAGIGPVCARKV